jgi:hypothetical protein
MNRRRRIVAHSETFNIDTIRPDTPLRLDVAAALAYPDGSMTASGLRNEHKRGRLIIERTAGKDYTTLADIERMRGLCHVKVEAHISRSRGMIWGTKLHVGSPPPSQHR